MLTKNEITALNLSPTKKDFVQIWNELLEVAGRLSERWDPTSTNESDPGIVILKALTGIADKLNYNIDKNTLEAFMPTAAQEDSMRKLCDMLGYNIKYYRSAETTVTIKWHNSDPDTDEKNALENGLLIPKFTVLTNGDQDINYFTINSAPLYISMTTPTISGIPCMEGQIVKCESTTDNNVITANQISDNNRFYLPEYQIAENGIFVYNVVANQEDGNEWEKVDNLNVQARGSRVFKFGYDSYEGRPYIEFPEDYSELINDGLFIYYARTSGANGNISNRTLTQLELPSLEGWSSVSTESFSVENDFSATTGSNVETISQAYANFKKTVGTFETLVTCRDYMNKIYSMTDENGKYLVSNALVTDIRTDLNRAVTICSCDDAGIFYKDTPLLVTTSVTKSTSESVDADGKKITTVTKIVEKEPAIDHFDLVLYPFKSYTQLRNNVKDIQAAYDKCFEYNSKAQVKKNLEQSDIKTIAHRINSPRTKDLVSINNYLRLNAIIGTTSKITAEEGSLLIDKIKIALANAFNMRELDFGDEIPFDSILSVIENADPRISVVSLVEPALYTTFSVYEGTNGQNPILREYAVASDWLSEEYADASDRFEYTNEGASSLQNKYISTFNTSEAKKIYNKLAVRNILAGRVPLFRYSTTFNSGFSDGAYQVTTDKITGTNGEVIGNITKADVPAGLATPDEMNPFTIYTENGVTYTGQWISSENAENIVYTKTYTPAVYKDNIITKNPNNDTNYTKLETQCEIYTDKDGAGDLTSYISDVTLSEGEFVKFRAPNFITNKTYPAYVNYHLRLNEKVSTDASPAKAYSLETLLTGTTSEDDKKRDDLLEYFREAGALKEATLTQVISGQSTEISDAFVLSIDDKPIEIKPSQILNTSGFMKLKNSKALLAYTTGEKLPLNVSENINLPEIFLTFNKVHTKESKESEDATSYVFTTGTIDNIKSIINSALTGLARSGVALPTKDWTISYKFEYVPFDLETLSKWEALVKDKIFAEYLFGFEPKTEYGVSLWRVYPGSYPAGKYVLSDGIAKLLHFTSGHFGLLDTNYLASIYVVEDLGNDAVPNSIRNNEEYQLREGECLFIEYTPSSTTEESSTQAQTAIKEILGTGTIIKPSGFEGPGLISSSAQESTSFKSISFDGEPDPIEMYSLGASEQIAIRELSKVELNSTTLSNSPTIYIYKNFNSDILEDTNFDYNKGKRSYTLKDGEYIFYTDKNQAEFAYFTSGTEVTLAGDKCNIPRCELIDISTIFDSGLQEIPWVAKTLSKKDSITFQEFQYITLGPNDTLKSLFLSAGSTEHLDSTWKRCDEAIYTVAGSTEENKLSKINLNEDSTGKGWEACSILELNTSPERIQTLRNTDKVKTSVTLYKTAASGTGTERVVTLQAEDADHPLSFKTNLACLSSVGQLEIDDIYVKPENEKSFELKVLTEASPKIVQTAPGKLVPPKDSNITDITLWPGEDAKPFATKSANDIWTRTPLTYLAKSDNPLDPDEALKLSISILPNTYGVFSIYLNYISITPTGSATATVADLTNGSSMIETWIDLLPGITSEDITVLNYPEASAQETPNYTRLKLKQGLNCIRVNKTCDLFIKTSMPASNEELTTSALYFDDLRLVDCQPVEYIENGKKKLQKTSGYNLAQIGYLDTTETDTLTAFEMQIRKKRREDATEEALSALEAYSQDNTKKLDSAIEALEAQEDKLQKLVDFMNKTCTEVNALKDNEKADEIFKVYHELSTDLANEKVLRNALANDKNSTSLERQLAELLTSLDGIEATKQAMLEELDNLELAASNNISKLTKEALSKGAILDDFESTAKATDEQLINDIKLTSIKEVNNEYTNKLAGLESAVKEVTDEVARNSLLAILTDLNAATHSKLVTQVQALANANSTAQAALTELISEVQVKATGTFDSGSNTHKVDYLGLKDLLVNLRETLAGTDITKLLSELNLVLSSNMSNTDKYSELFSIAEDLSALLAMDSVAETGNYAFLIATIDTIIASVQNKISNSLTSYDSAIDSAATALYEEALEIYFRQLSESLTKMLSTLNKLEEDYDVTIESLKSSSEEAVQAILNSIQNYNIVRNQQIARIKDFGKSNITEDYFSLPYGVVSVLDVWLSYMKQDYITGIETLYRDIRKAITNPGTISALVIPDNFYTNNKVLRKILTDLADLGAFQQLFEQTKTQEGLSEQSINKAALINALGGLITPSSEVSKAVANISNDITDSYSNRNAVLRELIIAWQAAPTLLEKQRLLKELITELDTAINQDTQLVEISANLLCPSVLLFPICAIDNIETDAFYARLYEYINSQKAKFLTSSKDFVANLTTNFADFFSSFDSISKVLAALKTNKLKEFTQWPESFPLLPDVCTVELVTVRDSQNIKEQLTSVSSCKLLTLLQNKNLVIAWQDKTGNWLDSSYRYYQKYTNYLNNKDEQPDDYKWVPYPTDGTEAEQSKWLDASGSLVKDGYYKTATGSFVKVDAKLADGDDWRNPDNDAIIKVKDGPEWLTTEADKSISVTDATLETILETLLANVSTAGQFNSELEESNEAHSIVWLEEQLLNDIRIARSGRSNPL